MRHLLVEYIQKELYRIFNPDLIQKRDNDKIHKQSRRRPKKVGEEGNLLVS